MNKTIAEIAKLANVSKTTVSLVINGHGSKHRISKNTQQKVLEIVKKTDFTLSQVARSFRLKKTQTIGLIVPDLTNWFFSGISYEIEIFARKYHHQVLIACSDDNEKTEYQVIKNLKAHRVEGYHRALQDNHLPFRPEIVFQKGYSMASGYELARKIYTEHNKFPPAIFTASLALLEGVLKCIKDTLGEIPGSIRIGTFDDHPFLDYMSPKICSVRQDTEQIAKSSAEIIFDALSGRPWVQQKIIKPRTIIRD